MQRIQSGKYLIVLWTIFLFGCSDNKKRGEFYSHVKTVKEFIANSPANLSNEDSAFSVCKIYSATGELIQANRIDGRINFKYTYRYDDKGREIEKREYDPDIGSSIVTTYKYNSAGNQVEEQNYLQDADGNKPTSHILSKYDNRGNKIEERDSGQSGLDEVVSFTYDDKGNNIETIYTHYNRGPDANEDDDAIDSTNIRSADTLAINKSVSETKGANDTLNTASAESGEDTIVYIVSSKVLYKYDDKGNEIEDKEYDSDGKFDRTFITKYEYDSKNNWTKKCQYLDGKLIQITKREFEYY